MQGLGHAEFVALWEEGSRLHPLDRGLLAIRVALPGQVRESQVADWPLGRRNRALAALRTAYFGPDLKGWTICESCGAKLEFGLDCRALTEMPEPPALAQVEMEGRMFRLPTSRDLAGIANETEPLAAATLLLERCVVDDARGDIRSWPLEKIDEVAERMAAADPLAEIALGLECPLCRHQGQEILDLASFVWREIEVRARRLLADVHILATAYGWAESAILALSDTRRACYLQMVRG